MDTQHELPPITLATNDYNRLLFTAMMRQKHNPPDVRLPARRTASGGGLSSGGAAGGCRLHELSRDLSHRR